MSTAVPARPRYAGRAAIITGGAAGIGLAIARRLASEGARVALIDADGPAASRAAAALGSGHLALAADVSRDAEITAAIERAFDALGSIGLVVSNAGILGPVARLWEHGETDFRRVLDVNLTGTFLTLKAAVPRLLAQPGPVRGRIVTVSSIQAKEGMPLSAAYASSKAGVIALTKTLGKELAREGVLVNAIAPAAAETSMASALTPERRAEIVGRIPMGRFVEVDEIAAMVAWLGSDDCTFSTGAVFDLSGGRATY